MLDRRLFDKLRFDYPSEHLPRGQYGDTTAPGCALLYGLIHYFNPKVVVETGTFHGVGSLFMCKALKEIGSGKFIGYEIQEEPKKNTISKLTSFWPDGKWEIRGDFWNEYDGEEIDFAYIDIEPKQDYVRAFKHLNMSRTSMVVAHDLFMGNEWQPTVAALSNHLGECGYNVLNLRRERGFIIGERN